jgi:hypothetical protein
MVRRKLFGRGKKESDEESTEEAFEEDEIKEPVPELPKEETVKVPDVPETKAAEVKVVEKSGTIPYHKSLPDRFKYMFGDPGIVAGMENTDEFLLAVMAMGERFKIEKKAMGGLQIETGTAYDEDVFIRVSNDAVSELLSCVTFKDFSDTYMRYYRNAEPGKFVKIELRSDISSLNRRGFARVPLLKLLIGAAR